MTMTLESSSLVYSSKNSVPEVTSLISPHTMIMSTKPQQSNGTNHRKIPTINTYSPQPLQQTKPDTTSNDLRQETSGDETGEADTSETESKYSSEEEDLEDEASPPEDYVETVEVN